MVTGATQEEGGRNRKGKGEEMSEKITSEDLLDYVPMMWGCSDYNCPKCGAHGDIETVITHMNRGRGGTKFSTIKHEFLQLACRLCGYTWGMRVKDEEKKDEA